MTAPTGPARARAALKAASPTPYLDRTLDPLVVEVCTAWASWDAYPASRARARRLDDALHAVAGDRAAELRRHVNDRVQESVARSEAVREWMALREEQA